MYTLFNPKLSGELLAIIDGNGKIIKVIHPEFLNPLELIISQIKRGVATEQAKDWLAVPASGKQQDCKTLQQLLGKQNRTGNSANLTTIKSEDRYTGRNWNDPDLRTQILDLHEMGLSIRQIAESIGVNASTLTRANRRYKLYPDRDCPIASRMTDLELVPTGCVRHNGLPLPEVLDSAYGVCKGGV